MPRTLAENPSADQSRGPVGRSLEAVLRGRQKRRVGLRVRIEGRRAPACDRIAVVEFVQQIVDREPEGELVHRLRELDVDDRIGGHARWEGIVWIVVVVLRSDVAHYAAEAGLRRE